MKKILKNKFVICILSGILFLILTIPTRNVLSVFTVTEVRIASVLNTVLGISFGVPSAIGIMLANSLADYTSGYSWFTIAIGVVPQFLYTYFSYLLWNKLNKGEEHIHRLDSFDRAVKYFIVVLFYAIFSAISCGIQVQLAFGANFLSVCFFVFLNNFTMALVLGCPLMVLSNQYMSRLYGSDRTISPNEKIIIATSLIQVISIAILIVIVYSSKSQLGTLDIWNTIYVYSIIFVNVSMIVSLVVMKIKEKKNEKNIRI